MPVYNRADTLPRALASIRAQTRQPAEIVVVDDKSTDASAQIAVQAGARVVRHERNQGAAAARNTALASAEQPWLATLDSDDEWLPDHLEYLWARRDSHVLVAGASASCFDDAADLSLVYAGTGWARPHVMRSPSSLIPANTIPASGVIVARSAVIAAGGYNTDLRYAEDWDLWLRVLEHGTALITPHVVCLYHRHSGQKSQDRQGPRETHDKIVYSYVDRPWWSGRVGDQWSGLRIWDALEDALAKREAGSAVVLTAKLVSRPRRLTAVLQRRLHESVCTVKSRRLLSFDDRTAQGLQASASLSALGEPG